MNWLRANRMSVKDPLGSPSYDLSTHSSVDSKIKNKKNANFSSPEKIKSSSSISLQKIDTKTAELKKGSVTTLLKKKDPLKLPLLKKNSIQNPESSLQNKSITFKISQAFYQSQIYRALKSHENTYLMSLARQHFQQTIEALRLTKNIKLANPKKQIKLEKKSKHKKTIYLDLDETLIHTDERSQHCTVKLKFPIETGECIEAGVRIRPYCHEFLNQLAKFAEVIIFTASSSSYANVILDYLDPEKKLFAHRLYRNHCTLEKGFYVKDLRVVNRSLENVAIVDNSAFSFLLQPENGIPILPFYHFSKDKQLESLIVFLKELVKAEDMRKVISEMFFWDLYRKENGDIKKLFMKKMKKKIEEKQVTTD